MEGSLHTPLTPTLERGGRPEHVETAMEEETSNSVSSQCKM
jgi:hypothetical protein